MARERRERPVINWKRLEAGEIGQPGNVAEDPLVSSLWMGRRRGRRAFHGPLGTRDHRHAARRPATGRGKNDVDDRRLIIGSWREVGRSALARSGKLLFGLGMTAALPPTGSGARKDKRAEDDADARKEDRREAKAEDNSRDIQKQSDANAENSETSNNRTKDESQEGKNRTEKGERREERTESNDTSVKDESTDGARRSVTRQQEANVDSSDDDGAGRRERSTEELAQNRARDDEPDLGDTTDDILPTPTVPSNPNIPVATTPDLTDADLFIEANPDVIASVSTSGGFAFARSGNVIAVSGPDGAQIIQTDDPEDVVTPSPSPSEPSDGGNNDIDFSS